jgi:hypothetical protein
VRKHSWLPSITLYFSLLSQTFLQPLNVNSVVIASIFCNATTCTRPGITSVPLRCASSSFRIKRVPTANHGQARAPRTSTKPFLSIKTSSLLLPPSYQGFKRTNSVTHPLSQQSDTLPSGTCARDQNSILFGRGDPIESAGLAIVEAASFVAFSIRFL